MRNDDYSAIAQHREMAGLPRKIRDFLQERPGMGNQALERMMAMGKLKELQSQFKSAVRIGFAEVAAPFEANEHAKDLADAAAEAASHLRAGEPGGLGRKDFQDVQALLEGGGSVAAEFR